MLNPYRLYAQKTTRALACLLCVTLLLATGSRNGQAKQTTRRVLKHKSSSPHQVGVVTQIICIHLSSTDPNCPLLAAGHDKGTSTSFFTLVTDNLHLSIERPAPIDTSLSKVRVTVYDVNDSANGPVLTVSRFLQPSISAFSLEKGSRDVLLKPISQRPANVHAVMITLNATDTDKTPLSISGLLTFPQR